jgi:hypothetical protein
VPKDHLEKRCPLSSIFSEDLCEVSAKIFVGHNGNIPVILQLSCLSDLVGR